MEKRILFVGGQQPLCEEFRTCCARQDETWTADWAGTGSAALALIERSSFDAVLVDARLSGSDGVDLLDKVARHQPQAFRLVLSDPEDTATTVQCVGRAHQHLVKPCSAPMILEALRQAGALAAWLPSDAVRGLVAQMWWVPSPPTIYSQILAEANSPDASVEKIGELIARDPAVTAKILQLANSLMFALRTRVTHPVEAVTHVGLETTKALVLFAHTFSSFDPLNKSGFSAEALWRHSAMTTQLARRIAILEQGGSALADEAFTAGLLHDIGKLLFAANLPAPFGQALALTETNSCTLWEAENQILGASHAEVGACLLGIWGLPLPLVQAAASHHSPSLSLPRMEPHAARPVRPQASSLDGRSSRAGTDTSPGRPGCGFTSLTAVHAADVFEHEAGRKDSSAVSPKLDSDYLQTLGLESHIDHWRSECLTRAARC